MTYTTHDPYQALRSHHLRHLDNTTICYGKHLHPKTWRYFVDNNNKDDRRTCMQGKKSEGTYLHVDQVIQYAHFVFFSLQSPGLVSRISSQTSYPLAVP